MEPSPATRKTITLSPEAMEQIHLPLTVGPTTFRLGTEIFDANGEKLATVLGWNTGNEEDTEIAAFIVDLVNAALTPTPFGPCRMAGCPDESTTASGHCAKHDAELRAESKVGLCKSDLCFDPVEPGRDLCPWHASLKPDAGTGLDAEGVSISERLDRR